MEQATSINENIRKERPEFLGVLCILSFVGISIGIILSVINLGIFSKNLETINQYSVVMQASNDGFIDNYIKWGQPLYIFQLIANVICFVGVWIMWNLKKKGYLIYVLGEILPVLATFLLMNVNGLFGIFLLGFGLLIPLLFIILYSFNLKHMS
ncbi:MAG TPA: hypothetical protein PLC59_09795 [Bacteroidales bacterium]|nr:hypothetical protein [Bacteroidales bacterium]